MIELQDKYDLKLNGMEKSLFLANVRIQKSEERIMWLEKQLESREENGDQNGSRLHATHSLSSRRINDSQDYSSKLVGNSSSNGYIHDVKGERLVSSG
ncbi:hypothetical protein ACJMK2_029467 [Sinanodonta woodiana]|uniref:Uncharacterized protein n=1 Tax=Sinanodonta woodiana TaxID=1069815 RepID=A0ABD3XA89_SINWO